MFEILLSPSPPGIAAFVVTLDVERGAKLVQLEAFDLGCRRQWRERDVAIAALLGVVS
jgi:hypothetical protein